MPSRERVIAVGLLTEQDLTVVGESFQRACWTDSDDYFGDLLVAMGQADRALRRTFPSKSGPVVYTCDRSAPRLRPLR